MSKTYDKVEWCFFTEIMEIGFYEAWTTLIFECISIVSYSILMNGKLKGEIALTRGIR